MSLEQKIELLTEQVTQLTDAVTVLKNVFLAQNTGVKLNAEQLASTGHAEAKKPIAAAIATAADSSTPSPTSAPVSAQGEDPNGKPSTTTDTSPPSSNESRTVTYDDVKNVTIAVSKIDKAKAVAGLARFGVATAKALNEGQWLDYVVYMERVQKGELDPEASHE